MKRVGLNQGFIAYTKQIRLLPKLLLTLALLFLFPFQAIASNNNILVILSGENQVYKVISEQLSIWQHNNKDKVQLSTITLNTDSNTHLDEHFENIDLIIAVGSRATKAISNKDLKNKTVLSTLIPKRTFLSLINQSNNTHTNAIFVDQPIARQVALAQVVLPEVTRVGVLSGYLNNKNVTEARLFLEASPLQNTLSNIHDQKQAAKAIKKLLRRSEVIIALPSQVTQQPLTAKWLLYMSYQRNVPVIGFSKAYLKAGALASVFSTPKQIAEQTLEWVKSWIEHPQQHKNTTAPPKYYSVEFNRPVGDSLGISIPSEDSILEKMKALLGEMQ